ncbi:MAG: Signal peptide peptidase SppA [Cyanobacteria bacterium RYN_339]|nr:Signal peptide peptidase SppA [Cyanobacteria bacterium RYN_339]
MNRTIRFAPTLAASFAMMAAPAWAAPTDVLPYAPTELGTLSSVATLEDASALAINPAALTFMRSSELFLSRSVNGLDQTNLFLTGGGVGTSWQQYRTGGRFLNNFTFGGGLDIGWGLAVGGRFSYLQFLDTQGGNSPNFGVSAMYRPNSWVSVGLTADNLTAPPVGAAVLRRNYRAGIGIRPGTDRVTLSLDGTWLEGDPTANITPLVGLQAELLPGLMLRGQADATFNYSVGLGLDVGSMATGAMSGVSRGRAGESDLVYLTTSDQDHRRHLDLHLPHMAYIRLEGELADVPVNALDLRKDYYPGVLHLTRRIAEAKADPRVTGMVLDFRGVGVGLGKLQELREAIIDFKSAGKTTIAYLTDAGLGEYYLASAADKVILHPAGALTIKGVAASVPFFRGVLDKLGVQPQFVGIGKYKSAPEQYMSKSFSGPAREEEEELLDAQFNQMVEGIAQARRLQPAEVKAVIDKGMLNPPQAKEKSLIDEIAYPDQVPGMFEKGPANTYPLPDYKPNTWAEPDILALVSINGAMTRGESGSNLMDGGTVGSYTITRALRDIRRNDKVKAVVVRVDSPGGDAVAADEIGRELDLLRLQGKPVIISMGDVAASGGYWVAANGTRVYAEPGTITGSIGVYTGQFAYGGLLEKVGITTETIKRGEHADMESGMRPLTETEITLLRDNARYTYGQFLERVATGRRMSTSRVDELAQGRVWAGSRAQDIGLIDHFGGLELAIADARKEAKLDPTTSVIEFWPKPGAIWQTLDDSTMDTQMKNTVKALNRYGKTSTWLMMPPVETRQ